MRGGPVNFPATINGTIAVGAVTQENWRAPFSNYGPELLRRNDFGTISTEGINTSPLYILPSSYAAPQVAGIVALMLSVKPGLSNEQVKEIIERTARDVNTSQYSYRTMSDRPNGPWHEQMGYGLVDATKALFYNRLSITGPAAPSTLANVSYSTTSNVSGATFNNWTVTPTSGVTISSPNSPNTTIRFTLSGNYNLKANYTLPGGTPYSGMKTITPIVTAPVTPIIHAETGGGGLPIPVGPGYQFIIQIDNYYGNGTIYEWDFVGLSKTGENGDLISVAVNSGMSAGSTVSARCRIRYGNNQYTGWSNTISTTYSPFVRRIMQNGEDQESI